MALYDANGNRIEVGGSSGVIDDGSIIPAKLAGMVQNVFDLSQNTEENVYTEYSTSLYHPTGHYWGGTGDFAGAHYSYLIPVKPGEQYYVQNVNAADPETVSTPEATAVFYTADKELTTQTYTLSAGTNSFVVPETAYYMRVPVHADTMDTVMVLKNATEPASVYVPYGCYISPEIYGSVGAKSIEYDQMAANNKPHRFRGAKVGCLGDSLTHMSSSGWIKRLKELMGFNTITNYGMSGTCVTSQRGEGSTFRDRAHNMSDELDLIIVFTSCNDAGAPIGVYNPSERTGTLADAEDKTVNDVSTIAGAGLELVDILKNKYPHKDIVFFSNPHTDREWAFEAADMYKKICARHSVPFFDLLSFCGMDVTNDSENVYYYSDGCHLTAAGNDRVADYMAACLRTL